MNRFEIVRGAYRVVRKWGNLTPREIEDSRW